MTLSQINANFMLHRQVCRVCASPGAAVCEVGMQLLRLFRLALNGDTPEAYRERLKEYRRDRELKLELSVA